MRKRPIVFRTVPVVIVIGLAMMWPAMTWSKPVDSLAAIGVQPSFDLTKARQGKTVRGKLVEPAKLHRYGITNVAKGCKVELKYNGRGWWKMTLLRPKNHYTFYFHVDDFVQSKDSKQP